MTVEIRPARAEELAEFSKMMKYAFLMGGDEDTPDINPLPEWTMCAFEDGRMVSTYNFWPFTMRFNGNAVPVAGVAGVATKGSHRRRGYLRKITGRHFQDMYERGERPVAILHPAHAAIYQRYGYGSVSSMYVCDISPKDISFSSGPVPDGSIREAEDDDLEAVKNIYKAYCADKTGFVHRGKRAWARQYPQKPPKKGIFSKIIYEENGEPLGYALYSTRNRASVEPLFEEPQQAMIQDMAWLTPAAFRKLRRSIPFFIA